MRRKREAISKRLRFEILRRDGSSCRYCGRNAPDVEIQVDHIVPVSLGGTNDLLNLVAACVDCNNGKSARRIDDSSMQRAQESAMAALATSVATQAEILARYKCLTEERGNQIRALIDIWWKLWGVDLGEGAREVFDKWIALYSYEFVLRAIYAVKDGRIESVGRYAAVEKMEESEPGTKLCYFIRGIVLKRFVVDDRLCFEGENPHPVLKYIDRHELIKDLLYFMRLGAPLSEIFNIARTAESYGDFRYEAQISVERYINSLTEDEARERFTYAAERGKACA